MATFVSVQPAALSNLGFDMIHADIGEKALSVQCSAHVNIMLSAYIGALMWYMLTLARKPRQYNAVRMLTLCSRHTLGI